MLLLLSPGKLWVALKRIFLTPVAFNWSKDLLRILWTFNLQFIRIEEKNLSTKRLLSQNTAGQFAQPTSDSQK